MKRNFHWVLLVALAIFSQNSFASANRVLDGVTITNGAAVLTLPTTTDTIPGRATTDTFTNKSMSGSSNTFTNIPAGTALSGQTPVANGGTSLATLTAGSLLSGNGTSPVALIAPGTSGNVLTSTGSAWSSVAPASAPVLTGSQGTPSAITAGGGIAFTGSSYNNIWFITGSGGAVTVTANPQVAAGTLVGQTLRIIAESASNTVTLADGTGLSLNGAWIGGLNSVLELVWDGSVWVEQARR